MSSSRLDPEQERIERLRRSEEIRNLRSNDPRKEKQPPLPPSEEQTSGFATFVFLLAEQILDFLKELINKKLYAASSIDIKDPLGSLKIAFETMTEQDKSEDTAFLRSTAQVWQILLEESRKKKINSQLDQDLKSFIQDIQSQPKNHEYSFGHYLEESATMHWLPLPYMELMKDLYRQHQVDSQSSLLTVWIHSMDKMLTSLE